MAKITKEEALRYHAEGKPGKIEVIPTKPHSTQTDLSLAYSPGVAEPCLEIEKNPLDAYEYTAKGNLVAVISNGTAVLGLGDIGPLAGKPVMEGKGLLFKIFAGIDVFDIEVNEKDPEKFIQTVKAISPTFGGINLEDIKAPECFEIETRLKNELDIPVMHDDQHGTAIISGAGLINALEIAGKKIEDVKIVVNGAGAASISCTKLYVMLGARKENIVMCDSKGVISTSRPDLNAAKREFATDRPIKTLQEAVVGADVFLGLSVANVLTKEMVRSMNADPIVFALANPNPEISYADAMASRDDIIFATGRSDYPNQINNVIEACPNIKYIGMCCTLYSESSANVDIAAARERGITVLGIRDYGDEGVVEYVISELVRLLHGFGGKQWRHKAYELGGQKVGIVGLGRTGRMIADALRFLGAEVYYFSRTRKPDAEAAGIAYLPLRELLPEVDILCTCLPRNTILLGADEFRLFGNLKILINTSVGPTFRVPDLQRWLSAHKRNFFLCDEVGIGNYADTLTQFDNVIYTPKVSGHSEQCMERLSQKVIANIESYLN